MQNEEMENAGPRIEKLLEEADSKDVLELSSLKVAERVVLQLTDKINENLQKRNEHKDDPALFMASEVDLHAHIEQLSILATVPKFYPKLVEMDFITSLLSLVEHENLDISIAVLSLLNDLIEVEDGGVARKEDELAYYSQFLSKLANPEQQAFEVIISNLVTRFEEIVSKIGVTEDEKQLATTGIFQTLRVVENLVEFNSLFVGLLHQRTEIITFFLRKIQQAPGKKDTEDVAFDQAVLFAAELLSIFCQNEGSIAATLSEVSVVLDPAKTKQPVSGLDAILISLSRFRKSDYETKQEEEYAENLFEVICTALLYAANQQAFVSLEGIQLLSRMIKERKGPYPSSLRCFRFLTLNHRLGCEKLVQLGGLKLLFPVFMSKGIQRKRKASEGEEKRKAKVDPVEIDETVVSILFNCMITLDQKSVEYLRFIKKFASDDFVKTERLVELFEQFISVYLEERARMTRERSLTYEQLVELEMAQNGLDRQAAVYLLNLSLGLETLERLSFLIGELVCADAMFYTLIKQRLGQLRNRHKKKKAFSLVCSVEGIARILTELAEGMTVSETKMKGEGVSKSSEQHEESSVALAAEVNLANSRRRVKEIAVILEHEKEWKTTPAAEG